MTLPERLVLVCGSREWPEDKLWFVTAKMIEVTEGPSRILTGGARGVDSYADDEAIRLGWPRHVERANWDVTDDTPPKNIRYRRDGTAYNIAAGYERNLRMLDMQPDLVLAFQWNGSGGTQHTIDNARARGIEVRVYNEENLRPDIAALDMGDIE